MTIPKWLLFLIGSLIVSRLVAPDSQYATHFDEVVSAGRNAVGVLLQQAGRGSQEAGELAKEDEASW